MNLVFGLILIALLIFANAFFVASEFSIVKIRKTRILQLVHEGNKSAGYMLDLIDHMDNALAAIQLGITIASIGLGWVGEATLVKLFSALFMHLPNGIKVFITHIFTYLPDGAKVFTAHSVAISIAFALITLLHVVMGELMPKSIAIQNTEKLALIIARPMFLIRKLFRPFTWILNGLGNSILYIFNITPSSASRAHSVEELDMIIDASHKEGVLNDTEKEILQNVFKFSDTLAKQVMVPRPDIIAINVDFTQEELINFMIENQYTRYPVFEEDIDHILGILHVKDIYPLICADKKIDIRHVLREAMLVPETITNDNLVMEFKKKKTQMAIVMDEFGSVSGIVTLEDVIEEIVGEVQDEFDEEEADIRQIYDDEFVANAMMRTDEFNEFFETDIEDEDVETLGGFVVKLLGHIAEQGDSVDFKNFTFTVLEVEGARIVKLKIKRNQIEEQKEDEQ